MFTVLGRVMNRHCALRAHSRIRMPTPMKVSSLLPLPHNLLRTYATEKHDMDELNKSTDYMHIQNILLQKEKELSTKHTLLKEATGFYDRFKINTKWFLIRGNRPFSFDELSTLFSWLIISQIIWVILGTTTFVSLVLFTFNTVFAKEMVGKFVGNTLNKYIDSCDVEFQDALVPEWKKGCIRFRSVKVRTVTDGKSDVPSDQLQFDLKFNQVDITLSVRKWMTGHGLIDNLTVLGMHGKVVLNDVNENKLVGWFSNPEYHLGAVKVCDSCFTLRDGNQDYRISIYNMDMNRLRFEWCVSDFFNANVVTGAINHSLFTIHKRQHKLAYLQDLEKDLSPWKRITRLRLDRISVKDLGLDKSSSFNWIEEGSVEIIADLMLPNVEDESQDSDEEKNNKYMVMDLKFNFRDLKAKFPESAPTLSNGETVISFDELKPIINYINNRRVIFNSVATTETIDPDWNRITPVSIKRQKSYPDTTVIPTSVTWPDGEDEVQINKEIIKYHDQPTTNTNNLILKCRIVKNIDELQNVALFRESGVYDVLAMELYVDLMKIVEEWEFKKKNSWMRLWGTTLASQLLIFGLGAMV
ncbi:Mdm32p [Kluyveromyces lactis]|uniref:Mitochondrial distribution and morphology protein 32 n=1 Tax=Kluyveromyces lactis (strain ATCC 8585 / CBS 2359 / DSM 70799 / NBRC 1267 / NRRL Y-1140 / WM37) TaxID=284590 RepID=MDM32_KLULA|nr:uncharacterized protein KLLA0_C06468g [Kluyveromyces lactis]Q6CUA4.1 RecName: Full=Mitochondrial distribution and morphology protein 32; Flags: Precursor [Kluyveromyces lactis NRRL Y-1140]CAH01336.1 KLLA0C06468p [Kluyveromyces lactis]|eukprot:XP_452485.1 uncharacterized protein KLLA0_C06468g [Kluyveromyces lactis]